MRKYLEFECNNELFEKFSDFIPDIEEKLNKSDTEDNIKNIERLIEHKLPGVFVDLYSKYDGEKYDEYLGLMLGFSLMSTNDILDTINNFKHMDFELMSMQTGFIKDDTISSKVPFASDGSGNFIAFDMNPDKNGIIGQIITIDLDNNRSYLLADSLEGLYEFIFKTLKCKKMYITVGDNGKAYFEFESGHLFNKLDGISGEVGRDSNEYIKMPRDFWKSYYVDHLKDDKVSKELLANEKSLFIKNENLSFKPLQYMNNLREVVIHNCNITDFSFISKASELRKLYIVNCKFSKDELKYLSSLSHLKELSLNIMEIESIKCLSDLRNLKDLSLRKIDKLNVEELSNFKSLEHLSLEELSIPNFDFINNLKSLKELCIDKIKIKDLSFLKNLTMLNKFIMRYKAEDERDINFISNLKKIKEVQYPVSDMSIYKECPCIEEIGVDAENIFNIEMLKDTNIRSVMVYNASSKENVDNLISKIKSYIELNSWGYMEN